MVKLTKAQRAVLTFMSGMASPWHAKGPDKAMCGKLLRTGYAVYSSGYPVGFSITTEGRKALEQANG